MSKFLKTWCNQTVLGREFGLSALAVGRILSQHQLKDMVTGEATEKALSEGYARPLPFGDTPFFLWNIKKCKAILERSITH